MRITTGRDANTYYKTILRKDLCVLCGSENWLEVKGKKKRKGQPRQRIRRKMTMTIDHLVPRRLQGQSHWLNYAPMCDICNGRMKSDRSLLETMLRRIDTRNCQIAILDSRQSREYRTPEMPRDWFYPLYGLLTNGSDPDILES